MLRPTLTLCCMALLAIALPSGAEPPSWEPTTLHEGTPYQSVEAMRSFYKLSTGIQATHKGAYAMGLGDTHVELGPGKREMRIGGILLHLSHPLLQAGSGGLLISREDWVKWVDPILRPTYIAGRSPVRTVVIDPGHGGHDEGISTEAVHEPDTVLQIAMKLKSELEAAGYQALLTRTGNYFLSDQQRVDIANQAENAIFLSLHLNSGRSDFRGSRVYTLSPAGKDETPRPGNAKDEQHAALAYALQSALVRRAGTSDGGCHRAHFSLLSSVSCPAVWVELGYVTHEQEGAALASTAYQDTLAHALAQGIVTYAKATDPAAQIPLQAPPPKATVKSSAPKKATPAESSKPRSGSSSAKRSSSASSGSSKRSSADSSRRSTRSR